VCRRLLITPSICIYMTSRLVQTSADNTGCKYCYDCRHVCVCTYVCARRNLLIISSVNACMTIRIMQTSADNTGICVLTACRKHSRCTTLPSHFVVCQNSTTAAIRYMFLRSFFVPCEHSYRSINIFGFGYSVSTLYWVIIRPI
jgi:hypothetical protein